MTGAANSAGYVGGGGTRRADDFYVTPAAWGPVLALHKALGHQFPRKVWEPACGTGEMAEAIKALGYKVVSSDLVDRGYGFAPLDFLATTEDDVQAPMIWTNPPFKLAKDFIEHSGRVAGVTALLLKATYWNAKTRLPLFRSDPPSHVLPLTWRLDVTGAGRPQMEFAWMVWGLGTETKFKPLPKPTLQEHPLFG